MKVLGISLFMFILLAGISFGIDLLQGFGVSNSFRLAFNPLFVMESPELAILILLLLILFARAVLSLLQKKGE